MPHPYTNPEFLDFKDLLMELKDGTLDRVKWGCLYRSLTVTHKHQPKVKPAVNKSVIMALMQVVREMDINSEELRSIAKVPLDSIDSDLVLNALLQMVEDWELRSFLKVDMEELEGIESVDVRELANDNEAVVELEDLYFQLYGEHVLLEADETRFPGKTSRAGGPPKDILYTSFNSDAFILKGASRRFRDLDAQA